MINEFDVMVDLGIVDEPAEVEEPQDAPLEEESVGDGGGEEPAYEEPPLQGEPVEGEPPSAPASPEDHFREEIRRLSAENASLAAQVAAAPKLEEGEAKTKNLNFVLDDEDFTAVMTDKDAFNTLLNRVFEAGRQAFHQEAPLIAQVSYAQQRHLDSYARDFYSVNKDLNNHKEVVHNCANEILRLKPDSTPETLFKDAAMEARRRLNLVGGTAKVQDKRSQNRVPGLPGSRNARINGQTTKPSILEELL